MKTLPSCICILGLTASSVMGADAVLMDQIGPDDGADIAGGLLANQYFEASFSAYDVAVLDNFNNNNSKAARHVSMVVGGWNGYVDTTGITGMEVNFYDDYTDAGGSLTGYISEQVAGTPDADPNWAGPAGTDLIGLTAAGWVINSGTQWVALIPVNEFGTNGQTGVAESAIGDGSCYQANPNGGFGFGTVQEQLSNAALRVLGVGDPCELPLPTVCNGDITGPEGVPDGEINVDDVLMVINTFGQTGNGESRPQGDCWPKPAGDCTVDVNDLLKVIGQFGTENCSPIGACCYGVDGCDEGETEADCGTAGGDWLGEGSSCITCVSGACCSASGDCSQATPADCTAANSTYHGDGTDCIIDNINCIAAPDNNDCAGAIDIYDGDTGFDTGNATTTGEQIDDCDTVPRQIYHDLYYTYTATCDGLVAFSTCGQADIDTLLAVYDVCGNPVPLACNDDGPAACTGFTSLLEYSMSSGDVVILRLGGYAPDVDRGTGTVTITCEIPVEGACCVGEDCLPLLPVDCADFGGVYNEGDCATYECGTSNDTCEDATAVACDSTTAFDTSTASDSQFGEPDDTQCDGTYLDWLASPDVWFKTTISDSGTIDVSLCDSASYDTSLVLYSGADCNNLTQVACNGDSSVETGCQSYYSGIYGHPVTAGDVIWMRIGGWQGATGPGNMTLTCIGTGATGACCYADESCADDMTSPDCDAAGGIWFFDATCADTTCPTDVSCNTGNGVAPHDVDAGWNAGTSDTSLPLARAATVSALNGVSNSTVYGLALVYSGGWGVCSTPDTMPVNSDLLDASYASVNSVVGGTYSATNIVYAGVYALHGWAHNHAYAGTDAAYLQVQSESGGQGECWFMWMSADSGTSVMNDGTGWVAETFALNYCIEE